MDTEIVNHNVFSFFYKLLSLLKSILIETILIVSC